MITRDEAKDLLHEHLKNDNLRKHCLAVAVIMEELATRFDKNIDEWYIAGLLHDIDLDYVGDDMTKHALKAMELLEGADLNDEILHAIRAHAEKENLVTDLDKWLWIADPISGLITAGTLMRPDKKISNMPVKSLKKKFKDKRFAASVSREQIKYCEECGIELPEFMELSIKSMGRVEEELGF